MTSRSSFEFKLHSEKRVLIKVFRPALTFYSQTFLAKYYKNVFLSAKMLQNYDCQNHMRHRKYNHGKVSHLREIFAQLLQQKTPKQSFPEDTKKNTVTWKQSSFCWHTTSFVSLSSRKIPDSDQIFHEDILSTKAIYCCNYLVARVKLSWISWMQIDILTRKSAQHQKF